ncbi:hypothetical membrane protein [Pseudomonas knackmussii B13]|uniref:Hypothetical membrane protein n=1 Tax=Pseudomonas knackmussii (strain DSM 6978 / CCUG 54928 / LMG 23759 / B13) TaxID=1301098 RepID=A0A024HDJ5_PSEKB|nr:hypothetical protein [Pseudomonas knackmussii]CDF82553.1 hypothetical membrane protein [Pseudomonas knackmussii B13]
MKNKNLQGASIDTLLFSILALSITQAALVNLLEIDAPLTPIFLILLAFKALSTTTKIKRSTLIPLALSSWLLLFTIITFATNNRSLPQEFIYQLFSAISFVVFILYFSTKRLLPPNETTFKKTRAILLFYLVLSLIIHLLLWDEVAAIFYRKDNDFGGLLMDGRIHRMYGLLFNPLASAFTALILAITLYLLECKDKIIYAILLTIIALSLSRSAILLAMLWASYALLLRHTKLYLLLLLPIALISAAIFSNPIYQWILEQAFTDDTGSISEHILNYQLGLNHVLNITGEGFRDARELGAWNVRLESMPLQYALTGGVGLFAPLLLLLALSTYRNIIKFGKGRAASIFFIYPLIFSFPLQTFNLPIVLFALLMSLWSAKYSTRTKNHKALAINESQAAY